MPGRRERSRAEGGRYGSSCGVSVAMASVARNHDAETGGFSSDSLSRTWSRTVRRKLSTSLLITSGQNSEQWGYAVTRRPARSQSRLVANVAQNSRVRLAAAPIGRQSSRAVGELM